MMVGAVRLRPSYPTALYGRRRSRGCVRRAEPGARCATQELFHRASEVVLSLELRILFELTTTATRTAAADAGGVAAGGRMGGRFRASGGVTADADDRLGRAREEQQLPPTTIDRTRRVRDAGASPSPPSHRRWGVAFTTE